MQKITPCLWFDKEVEEAADFYVSIFKNSKIGGISHYGEAGTEIHGRKAGSVMTAEFELNGQKFLALNGGPIFKFNEAVSFIVNCESQEEVDYYWEKLSDDGEERPCGWLRDKYGLSWQIVPTVLGELMSGADREKSDRVMQAMLKMKKLNIEKLKSA